MRKLLLFVTALLIVFSLNQPQQAHAQEENAGDIPDAPYDPVACQKECGSCKKLTNVCGRIQYDTCVDQEGNPSTDSGNFCKSSKYYRCYSKDNNNCASNYGFDLLCSACPNGKSGPSVKYNTDTCQQSCGACPKITTCGVNPTYDTCTDDKGQIGSQLCANGAKKFGCYARGNPLCQSGNLEYDCSTCPASTEKLPVTDADGLRPLNLTAITRCVDPTANSQEVRAGWQQISSNVFYKVTLYNGGAVESKCIDSNTFSHTFSGTFSSSANLRIALGVFSGAECAGTLMKSAEIAVVNANCGNNTPPANYILEGLRIGTDRSILDITGVNTKSVHLDGKEGTAQNFVINFEAYFSKTGQSRLYKALPIKFVYAPDGVTPIALNPDIKKVTITQLTSLKTGNIDSFVIGSGAQGNMLYLINTGVSRRNLENYGIDYNPIKLFSSISSPGGTKFSMAASGYNVYSVHDGKLTRFSFADLYHPSILKEITMSTNYNLTSDFIALYEKMGLLYVKLSDGNIISVKTSDLSSGQDINITDIKNMVISEDLAFILPSDGKTIDIYDISNLQSPKLISKNSIDSGLAGKSLNIKKDGDKLYIAAIDSDKIYVYSIADKKSLNITGSINAVSTNFTVFNGKLFTVSGNKTDVYKINFE